MTQYFRMHCTVCNAAFSSGTSAKSARSCRDRHLREVHGRGALRWRRERNAKRQSAYRRAKRSAQNAQAELMRALVLCPLRRERQLALFTEARNSLVDVGTPPSAARRLQGIDMASARPRDRVPAASAVVLRAVLRDFVPKARVVFATNARARYVLFLEDDCRMLPGVRVRDILAAARQCGD